jgi:DinB family protein
MTTAPAGLGERTCAALEAGRRALLELIASVPEAILDRKGVVGDWSIKNVLAHLAAWDLVVAQALPERLATGQTPEVLKLITADEDAWNALQVDEGEELTPEDQLAEFEWTRSVLLQYLRSLDDATLAKRAPWQGWDDTLAEYIMQGVGAHEHEHTEHIAAGLKRLGATA